MRVCSIKFWPSTDGKAITIHTKNHYQFLSKEDKLFDENGYFLDKNKNSNYDIESILISAVRSVIGRYNPKELSLKSTSELENELKTSVKSITTEHNKKVTLSIRINSIILENMIFSISAKEYLLNK